MKQETLFEDSADEDRVSVVPLAVDGSAPSLSKAQKQFNKWIAKIDTQRREIALWRAFIPLHLQRCAAEMDPLAAQVRERRIAMVRLLDGFIDGRGLTRMQKAKAGDILLGQLRLLLDEAVDPELSTLYDKYNDVSHADEQEFAKEMLREFASEEFGVDIGDDHLGASTPQELAERIAETLDAQQAETALPPKGSAKKSAKAIEREKLREQAEKAAKQSVRDIYRKLVSELHPDREPDLNERARKTALMQKVNQAYEAGDLLALLELQLTIEQIDQAGLASMAQERLAHFNLVLREQSERLRDELSDLTSPFTMVMGGLWAQPLTPDMVTRAFDNDLRQLRAIQHELELDLSKFQDIRELKATLKHYRMAPPEDDFIDDLAMMMVADSVPRRKR